MRLESRDEAREETVDDVKVALEDKHRPQITHTTDSATSLHTSEVSRDTSSRVK
jgi:hypothetical protein